MIRNGLLFVAAAALGVALSIRPWEEYRDQRMKADEAIRKSKQMQEEMSRLAREKAVIDTAAGKERLARERGYIKPDEVPLNQ